MLLCSIEKSSIFPVASVIGNFRENFWVMGNMKSGKIACLLLCLAISGKALANDVSAEMEEVAVKLKAGDFSLVPTKLTELAKAGDDRAQFNLAVSYAFGNGVAKNDAEAFKWYEKAAQQGNKRAIYNLASSYLDGKGTAQNSQEALKWYEKAAVMGDITALVTLGNLYSRGAKDIPIDQEKAFNYYTTAANKGSEEAQFNLAGMYLFGAGTNKDVNKAIEIYKKLAEAGNEKAAMILGEIYESDKYVQRDLPRAFAWYQSQYDTKRNLDAKSRVEFLKPFLSQQQFFEAQKIRSAIALPSSQFSNLN